MAMNWKYRGKVARYLRGMSMLWEEEDTDGSAVCSNDNFGQIGMDVSDCLGTSNAESPSKLFEILASLVERPICKDLGEELDFVCSHCGLASCIAGPNFCPHCGAEVAK